MSKARATVDLKLMEERRLHREKVARAKLSLQTFIERLRLPPYREGAYMLSMDLYATFED